MQINRAELKGFAKQLLHNNYWNMVLAGLVLAFATARLAVNASVTTYGDDIAERVSYWELLGALIAAAVVMYPLTYSGTEYFMRNTEGNAQTSFGSGFESETLKRCIRTFVFRDVMVFLFSLLFIVPGIIKAYEYYFTAQLLVDHPEMSGKEVCDLSRQMTNGRKMELFKLDLSFILWQIGSAMTWGLLGVLYANPYMYQTQALAYHDLVAQGCDPTRPAA